jgi:uncharacterized protein YkwD
MTAAERARGGRGCAFRLVALASLLAAPACLRPLPPPAAPPRAEPASAPPRAAPVAPADGRYGQEPSASLSPDEARVAEAILAGASAGSRPRLSGSLIVAARALAQGAAAGAEHPLDRAAIRDALTEGYSCDPAPAAFLARASPAQLRAALAAAAPAEGTTHLGVGVVRAAGGDLVAVVLTAQRRLRLAPFPRALPAGATAVLSGELLAGLRSPHVFVTLPSGAVREVETSGPTTLRAAVRFEERGRYVVEVVAEGEGGPTVAALMAVSAGGAPLAGPAARNAPPEPPSPVQAEAQVAAALAELRSRRGLGPLALSPELSEVARRHSAAMLATGRVAHLVPGSPGPAQRLARAAIPYQRVLENVAAASTALSAHEAAAESPAHLRNMLEPSVRQVGIGIARERSSAGDARVYLTEIFVEPVEPDEGPLTLDARIREALWQERARLGLPPLTADAALDELARDGAAELRSRDARELPALADRALSLRRTLAAVDVFVASVPREAARSRNLEDRRFRRVGVGVVEGASRRFGAGRLFIAVIYTD